MTSSRDLLRAGQYREALASVRATPSAESAAIAAACLVQLGDAAGALDEIRAARAGDPPGDVGLDVAEAEALTALGRPADAIALLEGAPPGAVLAEAYVAAGRHADALAQAEAVLARTPDARVHTAIAHAALALGDLPRADDAYAAAVEMAQAHEERGSEGWAHLAGGAIAIRRGDRAEAERRLDDAQEIAEELGMMPLVERCRALLRAARQVQAERTSDSSRRSES